MSDKLLYEILERGEFASLDFNGLGRRQFRRLLLYCRNICFNSSLLEEDKTILTKFFEQENDVERRCHYFGLVKHLGNGGQEAKELRDYFTDKFRNP